MRRHRKDIARAAAVVCLTAAGLAAQAGEAGAIFRIAAGGQAPALPTEAAQSGLAGVLLAGVVLGFAAFLAEGPEGPNQAVPGPSHARAARRERHLCGRQTARGRQVVLRRWLSRYRSEIEVRFDALEAYLAGMTPTSGA